MRREASLLALLLLVGVPRYEVLADDCANALRLPSQEQSSVPLNAFTFVRPDLSNPGARALALGGAFVSTADDTTSIVANPAGLATMVRPQIQVEGRMNNSVQYDVFNQGVIDVTADQTRSPDPLVKDDKRFVGFVSAVKPIGDKVVIGVVAQQIYASKKSLSRFSDTGSDLEKQNGPCFVTASGKYFLPLYRFDEDINLNRFGVSGAWRVLPSVSIGASIFYNTESRDQVFTRGDARGSFSESPQTLSTSSGRWSAIVGVLVTPSETLRLGASYSSKINFDATNEDFKDIPTYSGTDKAFIGTTVPSRYTVGLAWAPSTRLTIAVEGSLTRYSESLGNIDYSQASISDDTINKSNYRFADAIEARVGVEWTVKQTRTQEIAARIGFWAETPHRLQFTANRRADDSKLRINDAFRVLFSQKDDDVAKHVTGGMGFIVLGKQVQIDVGGDYEIVTGVWKASTLLGYSF